MSGGDKKRSARLLMGRIAPFLMVSAKDIGRNNKKAAVATRIGDDATAFISTL